MEVTRKAACAGLVVLVLACGVRGVRAEQVWFEVDPDSEGYVSATEVLQDKTVTVNIVADFRVDSVDVGAITVDNTGAVDNQGVSSVGSLNSRLTLWPPTFNGLLKPGDQSNIVIFQMGGRTDCCDMAIVCPDDHMLSSGDVLYSFEVLAGASGTTITIDDLIRDGYGNVCDYTSWPVCTGELNGDDWVSPTDLSMFISISLHDPWVIRIDHKFWDDNRFVELFAFRLFQPQLACISHRYPF
jgi:hypothetical protein